ncbi:DoxX family protein [Mucilaginibacter lutimaris]|uniref:DoxX family protein n=1 Tax=Mucilaginibacter lutimaris TaxID=931629 RepID=A0ABW2ZAC5_9SPHI
MLDAVSIICHTDAFRMIINNAFLSIKSHIFTIFFINQSIEQLKMRIFKNISLSILVLSYLAAGANHFIHPQGYISIIPSYLPAPAVLNYVAGFLEIAFAVMLIRRPTRKVASYSIIFMLIAFLPVHITMLQQSPIKIGTLMVTPAIAWARLLLQPLLMLWAWWHRE